MAEVVLEVEVRVVDPHRPPGERRERQLPAVARELPELRLAVAGEPRRVYAARPGAQRAHLEDRERRHVHVGGPVLEEQERRVLCGERLVQGGFHENPRNLKPASRRNAGSLCRTAEPENPRAVAGKLANLVLQSISITGGWRLRAAT